MRYGVVYSIFCTESGRYYVGQTTDIEERWKIHLSEIPRSEKPLYRAIRKHGIDSFVLVELTDCSSQEELDAAEVYWGTFLNALAPDGYCLRLGNGRGKNSKETIQKIREARKEQETRNGGHSPRWGTGKKPHSICQCGKEFLVVYEGRKYCSQECYAKYDHERMAKHWSAIGAKSRSRKIKDTTTGRVYASARAACRELGIPWGSFGKILQRTARFLYIEEEKNASP